MESVTVLVASTTELAVADAEEGNEGGRLGENFHLKQKLLVHEAPCILLDYNAKSSFCTVTFPGGVRKIVIYHIQY